MEAASKSTSVSMLINAAMRLLMPSQAKQFVTKLIKEEFISKYLAGSLALGDIAVNVSYESFSLFYLSKHK